jgi:hypothetical protein
MANGYCPALLKHINEIAEGNAPAKKMHVAGFLAALFCVQNSSVAPINDGNQSNGHKKTLTVKYRKRPTADDVDDTDDCEVNRIPGYQEWTIPNLGFKKTSWFLSDAEIKKYCDEASAMRNPGGNVPAIMQEHYELLLEHANILLAEINKALVTSMATQFGKNVTTGDSNGKIINIDRSGSKLILDNGIIDMLRDLQENEVCGTPALVGGGLLAAWDIARTVTTANAAGFNMGQLGMPQFFFDKASQAIWGDNSAGLMVPGSVKFMGFNEYAGVFAGPKGVSHFATIPMPIEAFGCNADACLGDLVFDLQMKYIDCPTEIEVDGETQTVNRGWQFILSKRYALWVQPGTAYETSDELYGTNGTLKYFFTNVADNGAAYAYVPS